MTPEQKKKLLLLSRRTLEDYIKLSIIPAFKTSEKVFLEKRGAFVTLKINGQLRGCIGRISAQIALYQTIQDMTTEAAAGDPRFMPVGEDELDKIDIEISVLSQPKKIEDISEIETGKHGLIIRKGFNSGLLLPQVASEYGWSREEFLMHTCDKAGISIDSWKDKDTQIYIFSAEVFGEKEL